ncbi:amidohydrolase family protein, partial [Sporofaciens musculi]|uniref:amidohydrolase family protein n=1 Tax=Sporofaciens musculi TaxID=2681861 RepID=UPI00259D3099
RNVWSAVHRVPRTGRSIRENQRVSVLDALKAITVYGAYQYFEEEEKGTIECKKRADFVILDRNPLKVSKEELADIKVVMTIKDNEVIYRRKDAVYE